MLELKGLVNKLVELYINNNEENFFVGYIIYYDDDFCLIRSIDKNGCFSSYQLIRKIIITNIEIDSDYLKVIDKYIEVSKNVGIYDKLSLDTIDGDILYNIEYDNLLNYILQKQLLEKGVISPCLKNDDDVFWGYIDSIKEEYIDLYPIDNLSLQEFEKIKILNSEIESLEFKGVSSYLLNRIY